MKMKLTYPVIVIVLFLAAGATAWSQATAGKVQGTITDGGKPVANADVVLTSLANGTNLQDEKRQERAVLRRRIPFGDYNEEVTARREALQEAGPHCGRGRRGG